MKKPNQDKYDNGQAMPLEYPAAPTAQDVKPSDLWLLEWSESQMQFSVGKAGDIFRRRFTAVLDGQIAKMPSQICLGLYKSADDAHRALKVFANYRGLKFDEVAFRYVDTRKA